MPDPVTPATGIAEKPDEDKKGVEPIGLFYPAPETVWPDWYGGVPASHPAPREELGKDMFANMVALGVLTSLIGEISPGDAESALLDRVPAGTEPDRKAFWPGVQLVNRVSQGVANPIQDAGNQAPWPAEERVEARQGGAGCPSAQP